MSKPRYMRELTADEREELERMMPQEVGRVAQRAQMISARQSWLHRSTNRSHPPGHNISRSTNG